MTPVPLGELEALVGKMRELGIARLTVGEWSVDLGPVPHIAIPMKAHRMPTDEEFLYAATEGFPELDGE